MKLSFTIVLLLSFSLIGNSQDSKQNLSPFSVLSIDTIVDPYPSKISGAVKSPLTKLDSVYLFDWINGSSWQQQQSNLHFYDEDLNDTLKIIRAWSTGSGTWLEQIRFERKFNDQNQLLEQVQKNWSNGWVNYLKTSYSYDLNHYLNHYIVKTWNGVTQSWDDLIKYIYDFDNEGNWTLYLRQNWNQDSLKWLNAYRFDYTYTNGLKTEFIRRNWNTDIYDWENDNQFFYSYDMNELLEEEYGELWNKNTLAWDSNTLITYLRNTSGNVTDKTYQAWNSQGWYNTVTYTYEYNTSLLNTGITYHTWDIPSTSWKKNSRYEYDYNSYGDLIYEVWKLWDVGAWKNDFKIEYHLSQVDVLLNVEIIDYTGVSCFGFSDGSAQAQASGGSPPYSYLWNDDDQSTGPLVSGLSGNRYYTVIVTDQNANTAEDSVYISEPDKIETGPIQGDTLMEPFTGTLYWTEEHEGSSYFWWVEGGSIVMWQGTHYVYVKWGDQGIGRISVVETGPSGCLGDTIFQNVYIGSVSLGTIPFDQIRIYPNPVNDKFIVDLGELPDQVFDLEIYDSMGRLVYTGTLNEQVSEIHDFKTQSGVYFLQIKSKKLNAILKILKL